MEVERMVYMADSRFKIAFDMAAKINELLSKKYGSSDFIPLEAIVNAVRSVSKYKDINVSRQSFSKIGMEMNTDTLNNCGAMLSTATIEDSSIAYLIINSDLSPNMQRFSVAHELGHLITHVPNFEYETADDGKFTISTHINADITYISDEEYKENDYLFAEQMANTFALLVLIPRKLSVKDMIDEGAEILSERYGVTKDAIYSRLLLSSVKNDCI